MKRYIGQGLAQRSFCPHGIWVQAHWHVEHSDSPSMRTLWQRTRKLSSWVFMETSLYIHDCLSHWSLPIDRTSSPSPLSIYHGTGLKIPTLLSHSWLHCQPAPILRSFPKVNSLTQQRHLYYSQHSVNSKDFGSCESRTVNRPNVYEKYIYWSSEWSNTFFLSQ